ncbi:hypothetical protein RVY14_002720 [Enterobacter cloacae]|nr:hypothetical protein [Enterobacter cloacae]
MRKANPFYYRKIKFKKYFKVRSNIFNLLIILEMDFYPEKWRLLRFDMDNTLFFMGFLGGVLARFGCWFATCVASPGILATRALKSWWE